MPLDSQACKTAIAKGQLSSALFKRLDLEGANGSKYESLLQGLDDVAKLEDPAGIYTYMQPSSRSSGYATIVGLEMCNLTDHCAKLFLLLYCHEQAKSHLLQS